MLLSNRAITASCMFVLASFAPTLNRQVNRSFFRVLLGHWPEDELDDDDIEDDNEEDDKVEYCKLPRNESEYSLGLNRNKSVDDLVKNFEWEVCSTGQRLLHGIRISSYALLAACMIAKVAWSDESSALDKLSKGS